MSLAQPTAHSQATSKTRRLVQERRHGHRAVSAAIVSRTMAIVDAMAIGSSGFASMFAVTNDIDWQLQALVVLLGMVVGVNILHLSGAYRFSQFNTFRAIIRPALLGFLLTFGAMIAVMLLIQPLMAINELWLALWLSIVIVLLGTARIILSRQFKHWNRAGRVGGLVAIVGAGPTAQRLLRSLDMMSENKPRIFGVYDDGIRDLPRQCMGHAILGAVDDLERDIRLHGIDTVIVALPAAADHLLVEILNKLSHTAVDVRLCPSEFALRLGTAQVSHIGGHTFLNVIDRPLRDWQWIAKSVEDRLLAAIILVMISPVLLTIALLIRLDTAGPILFRQKRYGFNNQLFEVLKFRTMRQEDSDANAEQLTRRNDPRITRVGSFLRRTSLDELPQFLNVLRGEMSIVGPRPHATSAKAGALLYQEAVKHYDARHRVKPGITGWAQINGWRGETDTLEQIRKRVEHDLYYIEHWSITLDLSIILRTVLGGFSGRNAF